MCKIIRTLGKRDKTVHVNWILQSQLFTMAGDRGQGVLYNSLNTRKTTAVVVLSNVGLGKERDLQSPVWEAPMLASTPYPLPLLEEGSPHLLQTFIICMYGCFDCTFVCVPHACRVPSEVRRGGYSSWNRRTKGCDQPCGCWQSNEGPL